MFSSDRTLGANRWHVVRLRGGCQTEVVLLSTRFFELTTHWVNQTVPCAGDGCLLCDEIGPRGLYYAAVMCNSRVMILELGCQSSSYLEQHARLLHGGMQPGQVYVLSRSGDKKPVRSECIRVVNTAKEVEHMDLVAHVMAVYKFPPPNPGEGINSYEGRCRKIAQVRNARVAQLRSDARDRRVN